MAFEVISLGDGEMLYNAFQGAAMIFNPSNISDLIKSGFIVGFLVISFKYIIDQQFQLRHALVAILLYMIMFAPKDDVIVGDAYTGEVRTVSNIPLGLAVPMSIVSNIGFSITRLFETAFSTPEEASMMNHGYLDTLQTLIHLKGSALGAASSTNTNNGNVLKSVGQYIENCVMFDLEIPTGQHEVTHQSLWKSSDVWSAMKTTFINRDVMIFLPNMNDVQQLNCKDAYIKIAEYLEGSEFKAAWYGHLRGVMGLKPTDMSPKEKIDEAVNALSITGVDSELFMRNALVASYLRDGPSAFIKRSAVEQLEFQWTGQASVLQEFARPIMSFIEMFTVCGSPIMAFLVTLGPFGIPLLVRYFQMMIWIAFWGPTMAVCNLYITIVTSRALETMTTNAESNGATIQSMIMHDQLFGTIEKYLGVGGMLMASVPALSMMMVYGAGAAAGHLSSKLGGDSSVNAKTLAPDPVSISSPISIDGIESYNPNTSASQGTGYTEKTFTGKEVSSRQKQAATAWETSAANTVSSSASKTIGSALRQGHSSSTGSSFLNTDTSSFSESNRATFETAKAIGNKIGRTDTEKEAIATNAAAELGASGRIGTPITAGRSAGLQGAINAALQSTSGEEAARTRGISIDEAEKIASAHDQTVSQLRSSQTSTGGQEQDVFATEQTQSAAQEYNKSLQSYEKAQQSSTAAASRGDSIESAVSIGTSALSKNLVKYASGDLANKERELQTTGGDAYAQYLKNKAEVRQNLAQSLTNLPSDQQEAIQRFGALLQDTTYGGAITAGEIFYKAVDPAHSDPGVSLTPDSFNSESKGLDDIVSKQDAATFENKATSGSKNLKGSEIDSSASTTGGIADASPDLAATSNKPIATGSAGHSQSNKPQHRLTLSGVESNGNNGASEKEKSFAGKEKELRKQIEEGQLVNTQGDHSKLLSRSLRNEGSLAYDSVVKAPVDAVNNYGRQAAEYLDSVGDKIDGFFGQGGSGSRGANSSIRSYHNNSKSGSRQDELPTVANE